MSKISKNEGLIQTGGTISANQIAVGRNAMVFKNRTAGDDALENQRLQEIDDKLRELVQALDTHSSCLANRDDLISSTELISRELSKDKPNKLTLTAVLDGIAKSVTSVTAVATIVEALKTAIVSFF